MSVAATEKRSRDTDADAATKSDSDATKRQATFAAVISNPTKRRMRLFDAWLQLVAVQEDLGDGEVPKWSAIERQRKLALADGMREARTFPQRADFAKMTTFCLLGSGDEPAYDLTMVVGLFERTLPTRDWHFTASKLYRRVCLAAVRLHSTSLVRRLMSEKNSAAGGSWTEWRETLRLCIHAFFSAKNTDIALFSALGQPRSKNGQQDVIVMCGLASHDENVYLLASSLDATAARPFWQWLFTRHTSTNNSGAHYIHPNQAVADDAMRSVSPRAMNHMCSAYWTAVRRGCVGFVRWVLLESPLRPLFIQPDHPLRHKLWRTQPNLHRTSWSVRTFMALEEHVRCVGARHVAANCSDFIYQLVSYSNALPSDTTYSLRPFVDRLAHRNDWMQCMCKHDTYVNGVVDAASTTHELREGLRLALRMYAARVVERLLELARPRLADVVRDIFDVEFMHSIYSGLRGRSVHSRHRNTYRRMLATLTSHADVLRQHGGERYAHYEGFIDFALCTW